MKIRKLEKSDLKERVEWMNSPAVYETMHFIPPITLDNTLAWFERNKGAATRCDMAFEDDNGQLVAMGGLTNIDQSVRKAEFYIFVNPNRQKEGIGTNATKLLCQYGFQVLKLHKIYLYTNSTNIGARKTYEKVGFSLEGIHRDELITDEKYYDRLYFGLLAKDFKFNDKPMSFKGWNDIILENCEANGIKFTVVRDDLYSQIGGV